LTKIIRLFILFFVISILIVEISPVLLHDDRLTATSIRDIKRNISYTEADVQSKFHEIKKIPYNERSMNCKNKSELFADYLLELGETNINIVTIQHCSGKYSHEFVEWNGHFYDACSIEISYKQSKEDYLKKLYKIGFNGLTVSSPYVHKGNKARF